MNDLRTLRPGDEFISKGTIKYIVLENNIGTIFNNAVLLKKTCMNGDSIYTFGRNGEYKNSNIREILSRESVVDDFKKDVEEFGEIIPSRVDLMTLDGVCPEDDIYDMVRLMSLREYQKYRPLIEKSNPRNSWWLSTMHSHVKGSTLYVQKDSGAVYDSGQINKKGIRPIITVKFN